LVPLFWKIYDREKLGRTDGSKTGHDCTPELQPISQSVSSGSGAHDGTICFGGFGPRSYKCMFPSPILEYCIFKVDGHRESVTPPAARRAAPEIINCTALMVNRSVQNLNSHAWAWWEFCNRWNTREHTRGGWQIRGSSQSILEMQHAKMCVGSMQLPCSWLCDFPMRSSLLRSAAI
jgi:hypothetical protein